MSTQTPDIDPLTRTEILPHEWDGIRELDTAPPRWWLLVYAACFVFSVGYWLVYPAWPMVDGFSRGLFGWSSRGAVADSIAAARTAQAPFDARIQNASVAEIQADGELLRYAMAGGRAAFLDNCAQCHGAGAQGQSSYPSLLDDDWLWGGTAEEIEQTIRYGIRSGHPDTREMMMPAFGVDGILDRAQIELVADHVLALSQPGTIDDGSEGAMLYADNCAACHGAAGEGDPTMGVPRLSDGIWLYGGSREDVITSITRARAGVMPAWEGRLSDATIKKLTVFIHSMGGGQ